MNSSLQHYLNLRKKGLKEKIEVAINREGLYDHKNVGPID
jgi:hypothetical protein